MNLNTFIRTKNVTCASSLPSNNPVQSLVVFVFQAELYYVIDGRNVHRFLQFEQNSRKKDEDDSCRLAHGVHGHCNVHQTPVR